MTSILKEWQKMPTSKAFPPCAQRLMVVKALNKAELVGLSCIEDRGLYALCYLAGRKDILESETLKEYLSNVIHGNKSLSDVVINVFSEN